MSTAIPKNILLISAYGADLAQVGGKVFSGAQRRQCDYAEQLDSYSIIVPSPSPNSSAPLKLKDNLTVYPVISRGQKDFATQAYKLAKILIRQRQITGIMSDNPFLSAVVGARLKQEFGLPLVIHSMAEMINNPFYLKERLGNFIKNLLALRNIKFADLIRVSTEAEISYWRGPKYLQSRLINVPFYIDFTAFEQAAASPELRKSLLGDKFKQIILYVGRIAKQKDLPTLLRAMDLVRQRRPDILLVIVGDGPERKSIARLIKKLNLASQVKMVGKVKYGEIAKYFKASDLFCITSLYEGTCMVLHEAAICRLPAVATNFAGARDFIKNGENGYLASIGDYRWVAAAILKILADEAQAKKMGESSYQRVKSQFSARQALVKFGEMIKRLLGQEKHK